MTKAEIKKAQNHELIVDYVRSYSSLMYNYNCGGGVKMLEKHCNDLEMELLKRGLLTEAEVKYLNA